VARLDYTGVTTFPTQLNATHSRDADSDGASDGESNPSVTAESVLTAEALLVTDGDANIYWRCDGDGIRGYDAQGRLRCMMSGDHLTIQRPTDADPDLIEFVDISGGNLLAIATIRTSGGIPTVKCVFWHRGLEVFPSPESLASVKLTRPSPRRQAQMGETIEAQRFEIIPGPGSVFDRDSIRFRPREVGSSLTEDGLLVFNDAGVCRLTWIRWDGVYFYDENNALLSKVTADGFSARTERDSPLETFLTERLAVMKA
jgi:hypothetical protein